MKRLSLFLYMAITLFCISATPGTTTTHRAARRASVNAYAYFGRDGYNIGICSLPIMLQAVYRGSEFLKGINCNNGSYAVIDVAEGDIIHFKVRVYFNNQIQYRSSPPYTVTANDIANGRVNLVIQV